MDNRHVLAVITMLLLAVTATSSALASTSSGVTYHGRIVKPDGTPLTGSSVQFQLQIRSPGNESCLLYQEIQTLDMTDSNGVFSLTLNDGSGTRTDTSGYAFDAVFSNRSNFTLPSGTCTYGTAYNPNTADGRTFLVSFRNEDMASFESVAAQPLNFAPIALQAKNIGGFAPENLLRFDDSVLTINTSPLNNTQYGNLIALINGTSTQYLQAGANGAGLPVVTSAPSAPVAGDIWFNSTSGTIQFSNGTSTQSLGGGGGSGSVISVATGTGLTGGPITTSGTLSLATFGTTGSYYKVTTDAYGRVSSGNTSLGESDIPTLSTAGHVSGSAITSGTIAGSTAISTTGNVTAQNISASAGSFNSVVLNDGEGTPKTATLQAPSTIATSYVLKLPTALGSANQVLTTDAAGHLSWTTPAGSSGSTSIATVGTVTAGTWNASTITVPYGGTGATSLTAHGVLLGEGSSAVSATSAGTTGNVLTSSGASSDPTWGALNLAGGASSVSGSLPVGNGGTGASTLTGAGIFTNGGNSFGAAATLGTADANGLSLETSGSPRVTIAAGGNVGIGTTSPANVLHVVAGTIPANSYGSQFSAIGTNATATETGLDSTLTAVPASAPSSAYTVNAVMGISGGSSANINANTLLRGVSGYAQYSGTGTVGATTGLYGYTQNQSSGTVGNAAGGSFGINNAGTITSAYGINIGNPINTGTITTDYGLYISPQTSGVTNYALYSGGGTNYFGGNVGIGTTSPANALDVAGSLALGSYVGTAAPSNSLVLSGQIGIGTNSPGTYTKAAFTGTTSNQSNITIKSTNSVNETVNGTYNNFGMALALNPQIGAGVTNSGADTGLQIIAERNAHSANENGTETAFIGEQIIYGNSNTDATSTPQIMSAYGLQINSQIATGSATNMYDLYLAAPVTGGTVTNHYGLYQVDTASRNYFGGNVGIGTSSPANGLDLATGTGFHITTGVPTSTTNALYNNAGILYWNGAAVGGSGAATSVSAGNGTAAAPSMSFSSDTGTGLYDAGSHTIGVSNNGTESMVLSATGIAGTGAMTVAAGGTNQNLTLSGSGTGSVLLSPNVGIGTTSPSATLHLEIPGANLNWIYQNSATGGSLFTQNNVGGSSEIDQQSAGAGYTIVSSGQNLGVTEGLGYDGASMQVATATVSQVDGAPAAGSMPGRLVFKTTPSGSTTPAERMRITSSGNVGIGTTSPGGALDVESTNNIILNGGASSGNVGIGTMSPAAELEVAGNAQFDQGINITAGNLTLPASSILIGSSGSVPYSITMSAIAARTIGMVGGATSTGNSLTLIAGSAKTTGTDLNGGNLILESGTSQGVGSSNIQFQTATPGASGATTNSPTTKMTILGSGNVGIGTTSPLVSLDLSAKTDAIALPKGTTEPSSPQSGWIRYNTSSNLVEFYNGTAWSTLGSGGGSGLPESGGTMTGQLVGQDGTNSAPGYAFSGDTNTGIYDISTGLMGVSAAGAQVASFGSTGETLSAGEGLTLASGTGKISQTYSGTGPAAAITDTSAASGNILNLTSTSTAAATGDTALNIAVSGANATASVTRYGVQSAVTATGTTNTNVAGYFSASGATNNYGLLVPNGSVGIGTTSPNGSLDIEGTNNNVEVGGTNVNLSIEGNGQSGLNFSNATASDTPAALNFAKFGSSGLPSANNQLGNIIFNSANSSWSYVPVAEIKAVLSGTPTNSSMPTYLSFYTTPSGSATPTETLRIDATGNVGIGTTSPQTKLDVAGPVNMQQGYFENVGSLGSLACGSSNITGFTTNLYTLTACASGTTTLNIPTITGWPTGSKAWTITFMVTGQTASVFNVNYNGATTNVFWDQNSTGTSGGNNFAGFAVNSGSTDLISCMVLNTGSVNVYCSVGAQY